VVGEEVEMIVCSLSLEPIQLIGRFKTQTDIRELTDGSYKWSLVETRVMCVQALNKFS